MKKLLGLVIALCLIATTAIGYPMAYFDIGNGSVVEAASNYSKGYYKVTPSEGLNLRAEPGTSHKSRAVIKQGVLLKVIKVKKGWGYTYYHGKKGWIALEYVKYLGKYLAGHYKVVADVGLCIRKGAATSYKKEAVIPYKKVVAISRFKGIWGYTSYGKVKGWVCMKYVRYTSAAVSKSAAAKKTVKKKTTRKKTTAVEKKVIKYVVTADVGLRLRKGPSTSYKKVGVVPYKTVLTLYKIKGSWGYTKYGGTTGWVWTKYLKKKVIIVKKPAFKSKIIVSNATWPSVLKVSQAFTLKGQIKSKYNIKAVHIGICGSNGKWLKRYSVKKLINKKTFDIHDVDPLIKFDQLPNGTYRYRVAAIDEHNYSKNLIYTRFTIKKAGPFRWPCGDRSCITSYFGYRSVFGDYHPAIDIAVPKGTPIKASRKGTVIVAQNNQYASSYGKYVIIEHSGGYQTLYAHSCKLKCSVGDKVSRGEVIALVGSTGNSTGPHCHFEIRYNGVKQNPLNYLP